MSTPPVAPDSATSEAASGPADIAIGSFSNNPPWIVEPASMPWREVVDSIRWLTKHDLPELTSARRLPDVKRAVTVVADFGSAIGMWWATGRRKGKAGDRAESRADLSRRLRRSIERLGPTYIKLAQIISSGEGLFPEELVNEFKKCRDQVPAQPFDVVRATVEEDFGAPLEDIFASFDETPLAAASIAQVHAAVLLTGEPVVVKVQRTTVALLVNKDIRVMAWLAPFLVGRLPFASLANPPALVELFAETISEELDFRLEAQNMLDVAASFVALKQRGYIVPRPHPTLVTRRVLVMERLAGFNFDDVDSMRDAGVDTHEVVRTGMIGFMEGAIIEGIFHGDLHGGNLFVLPDGKVALLDFGITGRMDERQRRAFLRLMLGATVNDVHMQIAALCELGALPLDTDIDAVIADLGLGAPTIDPTTADPDEMIQEVQKIVKMLLGYGARMPKELMLYVKNLVFLDGAIARLAPDLDIFAEITQISMYFVQNHGEKLFAEAGFDASAFEIDLTGVKDSIGLDRSTDRFTYRDLQERRELIKTRFEKRGVN
ncbi:MAG: AarF/UbiB family protein [Actinobacteria bacterium]|jgi:ubiquinone biosynthesis protein|nr:AarF/UbiB family protein [Actinomycetota bacterium]